MDTVAREFEDDPDLLASMKDSLQRQVALTQINEVKKQIAEQKAKNRSKALDLRRSTENQKAGLILHTLALRRELQEGKHKLQEHKFTWRSEVSKLAFEYQVSITQNHEALVQDEKNSKIALLQAVLKHLDFDSLPLIQRNLRYSSVLQQALQSPRSVIEEETTNDRYLEQSGRDYSVEDETERVCCADTPKVALSRAVLTDDIRAALNGEVFDDETERKTLESKIQARLLRVKHQIVKYIRGEKLNSKGAFPSESIPMFDISSCEKSDSKEDLLDEMSSQSLLSNVSMLFSRSQASEKRQVSVLSFAKDDSETECRLDFSAMSPIIKQQGESCKSSDLSLSNSVILSAHDPVLPSRRTHSLVVTSPRDGGEQDALCTQQALITSPANNPFQVIRSDVTEEEVTPVSRVKVTSPKHGSQARWRKWFCGCICSH